MIPADYVVVRSGGARWLEMTQGLVAFIAGLAILFTQSSWILKAFVLIALAATYLAGALKMRKDRSSGELRLFTDGTAIHDRGSQRCVAVQGSPAWVSRWFCMIPLVKHSGTDIIYCMICASNNHPDNYRRLLIWLRMHHAADRQGLIG